MSVTKGQNNFFNKKVLFKYALQGVVLTTLVVALMFFLTASPETWVELRNFNPLYIFLITGMTLLAWLCNSSRIYLLTHSVDHNIAFKSAAAISVSTEFGVGASPGGVGGSAVRVGLLVKSGLELPKATALFATDLFVDCLYFLIMMPLAVFIIFTDPTWNSSFQGMGNLPYIIIAYMTAVIVIITLCIRYRSFLNRQIHKLLRKHGHKKRLSGRWRIVTGNFSRNIKESWSAVVFLWKKKRSVLFLNFLLSSIQLTCRYSTLPILLLAFSCDKNPFPLFFIQGVVFLLSAMLVLPGGGGASEIITSLILPVFVNKSLIGVIVLLWRVYTYYFYLFIGGAVFSYTINHLGGLKPIDKKNDN